MPTPDTIARQVVSSPSSAIVSENDLTLLTNPVTDMQNKSSVLTTVPIKESEELQLRHSSQVSQLPKNWICKFKARLDFI